MKPRVFLTRHITPHIEAKLASQVDLTVWPDPLPPPYEVLCKEAQNVDGLLCLLTDRVDRALLSECPSLRVVSQMAVGYDNIEVQAATDLGIPVGHTPGVLTETTADLTWALMLAAGRRVLDGVRYIEAGDWKTWAPLDLLGIDFHQATLGIVGMGRIGQAVARRAQGFGMRVIYSGPSRKPDQPYDYVPFKDLLRQSDIVTLHCPLNAHTYHLIDKEALALMKPGAVLVNTARGGVVDQEALMEAMASNHLAAAGLDVTTPEPLPADHPLMKMERVIVTPHMGSSSLGTRTRMGEIAVANLLAGLEGKPLPHAVNPEVYV